ncbi:MAG: hypothetical protein EOO75_14780 [Myxococcales bacterium]|nr:MAG: hypothetical protein EOO75_14780 [Myxococcales bacterium]
MAALVTVTDPSGSAPLGPLGTAVQEATVPDTVKEMYERAKVTVSGRGNGFVFVDGSGQAMTENEFARRFQATTGSNVLEPVDRRRNQGAVVALAAGTAASIAALTYGLLHFRRYCQGSDFPDDTNCSGPANLTFESDRSEYYPKNRTWSGLSLPYIIGGGLGTAGLGTALVFALLNRDGTPDQHHLSDREAVLYASQYNRAILRRSLRDVQQIHRDQSQGPTIQPYVTPEGLGVWGRF